MSVVFAVCCAGSGLCDELITRSEEYYRVCVCVLCVCVCVCVSAFGLETSKMRRRILELGRCATEKKLLTSGSNENTSFVSASPFFHDC